MNKNFALLVAAASIFASLACPAQQPPAAAPAALQAAPPAVTAIRAGKFIDVDKGR